MNYILFDPPETRENMLPLTFTRPVSEIRIGILKISEKWETRLNTSISWLTEEYLSVKYPSSYSDDNLFINGSLLPDENLHKAVVGLKKGEALYRDSEILAVRLENPEDFSPTGEYNKLNFGKDVMAISYPWDIFSLNGKALSADFDLITSGRESRGLSDTNMKIGKHKVFIEEGSSVECSSFNTENGPVYIGKNAEVMEGCLIRGPFALCDDATLKLGAKIYGPTTVGPHSKVGGEVNNSIITGYTNKAHDGFLGNSVIGEWCNIGADSNNSNLKNNYSAVRLWNYREEKFIHSGLTFCGLIMGDHSKCGINTMFNTGTVVGVNANIYGAGFPRNFIPSFSWGGPQGFTEYKIDKALEVAAEVMKRRNIELGSPDSDILKEVWGLTEKYRS